MARELGGRPPLGDELRDARMPITTAASKKEWLKRYCGARGMSLNELVNRYIDDLIEEEGEQGLPIAG